VCLPLVLFATILFPRYGLLAAIPLLLVAAWLLAEAVRRLAKRSLPVAAPLLLVGVLAWPAASLIRQSGDFRRANLVAIDRSQYISGWTAGYAVREAIGFIEQASRVRPVIVINVASDAYPNLAVAVFFERNPRVRVYHADVGALASSVESWRRARQLFGRSDFRYTQPLETVAVPDGTDVLVVRPEPLIVEASEIPERWIATWGHLGLVARFENPRLSGERRGGQGSIRIERIR
jgi:hypothetical protein